MRWRLDLEYDGTDFVGWQRQANGRSVQGEVERALGVLLGHVPTLSASGRTDAGVHAELQVASFVTDVARRDREVMRGLNRLLADDVACLRALMVEDRFDPRQQVVAKTYRYAWLDREARSPLLARRAWHLRRRLDVEAMNVAVTALVGQHDFATFRATGCAAQSTIRTISSARVHRVGDVVSLRVNGHGFLRHMVRIIAGCVAEVGQGRWAPTRVAETLDARDRRVAARTAPALGLTLESVTYEACFGG